MTTRFAQFNQEEIDILSEALDYQFDNSMLYLELLDEKEARKKVAPILCNAIEIIKHFEGLYLNAYLDSVNIPTIGYGTIQYPNSNKVKLGDVITESEATEYLMHEVN